MLLKNLICEKSADLLSPTGEINDSYEDYGCYMEVCWLALGPSVENFRKSEMQRMLQQSKGQYDTWNCYIGTASLGVGKSTFHSKRRELIRARKGRVSNKIYPRDAIY